MKSFSSLRSLQIFSVSFSVVLFLSGCTLMPNKENTSPSVAPSETSQASPELSVSPMDPAESSAVPSEMPAPTLSSDAPEISKKVYDLVVKKEPIPADTEKAFLEYAIDKIATTALTAESLDFDKIPSEVQDILNLLHGVSADINPIQELYFEPKDMESFLKDKAVRKVCYGSEKYAIKKGNACDLVTPEPKVNISPAAVVSDAPKSTVSPKVTE